MADSKTQQQDLIQRFLEFMKYVQPLEENEVELYSADDLAKVWGIEKERVRSILRKLRREGFIRRTKSGKYKLTLAAKVLIRIYKRVKR
ncbi:hypothetical protein QPL79_08020 [Ignisphaera sp. 4213-co]|uniref:Uncharacterized protein n=1 Tax=Ignisphaera cupida TaxID=3050454 RepID=A0ABD4Z7J5_9CREN|nr:hypothetical protein [Ignisphaera sp. 4213-co]MDK6029306.1 hypothetical protein [Ignisphaera sp. 4213-co]